MNEAASKVPLGSEDLKVLPFGNGAERMLGNKTIGAQLLDIDLNKHGEAHICRAVQEGIAFAFRYGLDIMRENRVEPSVIRAGRANLFLSDVFVEAFVNCTESELELYENEGSVGAAIGAGIGAGIYQSAEEALKNIKPVKKVSPSLDLYVKYENYYHKWKMNLEKFTTGKVLPHRNIGNT
jgi:xylulokinase